ncbi:MAG: hypothetical protein RMK50_04650 [Nitrososphaerota archaeon]|nr:hypothetical protein [Candidatus Bathyarchaeota archaeon]MDW8194089.1 hypothetical protein [Nitrososphaerota archaeon]
MQTKQLPGIALITLLFLSFLLVAGELQAFAWDPPEGKMRDLAGTDSSSDHNVTENERRFDIYT